MQIVGIDFGASGFRMAADRDGTPALIGGRHAAGLLRQLVCSAEGGSPGGGRSCRVVSLKRELSFDAVFPPQADPGRNAFDLAAEAFANLRADAAVCPADAQARCVVAVPHRLSQVRRSAVRKAAAHGGFTRVRLVDDTLAALLRCAEAVRSRRRVLVYSWGASTFSVALYRARGPAFETPSQDGDMGLGGDDLDGIVATALADALRQLGLDVWRTDDATLSVRLIEQAEAARRLLADGHDVSLPVERIMGPATPPSLRGESIHLPVALCEGRVADMVSRTLALTEAVLKGQDTPEAVILVGGMTHLATVRKAIQDRFGVEPVSADDGAVACGALLHGKSLSQDDWEAAERAPVHPPPPAPPMRPRAATPPEAAPPAQAQPARSGWTGDFIQRIEQALALGRQGQNEQCVSLFEQLFQELGRFCGEYYRRLAAAFEHQGNLKTAYQLLKVSYQRAPGDPLAVLAFVKICRTLAEQAISARQPHEVVARTEEGARAIRGLEGGTQTYSSYYAVLLCLNGAGLCQQGHLTQAEEVLKASLDYDPNLHAAQEQLKELRAAIKRSVAGGSANRAAGKSRKDRGKSRGGGRKGGRR